MFLYYPRSPKHHNVALQFLQVRPITSQHNTYLGCRMDSPLWLHHNFQLASNLICILQVMQVTCTTCSSHLHPLFFSLLPVSQMNETSVTVEIQHDGSVHQGPCTANAALCKVSSITQWKYCQDLHYWIRAVESGVLGVAPHFFS